MGQVDAEAGLVVAHFGAMCEVSDAGGHRVNCHLRQQCEPLVTGDRVLWQRTGQDLGVVEQRLPRVSVLGRPNAQGEMRAIAANVDQLLIVVAPVPALNTLLLDSYLIASHHLNIPAVIIANKQDLLNPSPDNAWTQACASYAALGYHVIETSVVERVGLDTLREMLNQKISVFIGQSGVGKSSLINTFVPEEQIRIGEISQTAAQGRHTTTTTRLYFIDQDSYLIDSPGVREFGLWQLQPSDIAQGFREFLPYLTQCKFRDCLHLQEPHCAIREAVDAGHITPERYANYQRLIQ